MIPKSEASETLERMFSENRSAFKTLLEAAKQDGMDIDISNNDVTYTCDLSGREGITENSIKDPETVKKLEAGISEREEDFKRTCRELQDENGIEGVRVIVRYTFGNSVIASQTFTA